MNSILQNFGKISQINQLDNLGGCLNGIPFLLFVKDLNGNYLHANHVKLDYFGLKKENEILGSTDFDLCMTHNQAIQVRDNDKKVIKAGKACSFLETATVVSGETLQCISHKSPLRTRMNKIIGMVCAAFVLPDKPNKKHFPVLSERQNECLNLLAYGMTIKEIAREMQLSPRTVEHYLEVVKAKLNCDSRSDLIRMFIEEG